MYSIITAVLLPELCHLTLHIQYMLQFGKAFSFSFYSCNKVLCSSRVNTREPSDWRTGALILWLMRRLETGVATAQVPGGRKPRPRGTDKHAQAREGKTLGETEKMKMRKHEESRPDT